MNNNSEMRKFGLTMCAVFMVLTIAVFLLSGRIMHIYISVGAVFGLFAIIFPALLKPVNNLWMKLAFVLSWLNTRLILIAIFYLVITPIGLIMRVIHKSLLEKEISNNLQSYWKEVKEQPVSNYQRQF